MDAKKNYEDMTKQEKYTLLATLQKVLEGKFGEMSVEVPSLCTIPIDISVSSLLLMVQNEKRMLRCEGNPDAK